MASQSFDRSRKIDPLGETGKKGEERGRKVKGKGSNNFPDFGFIVNRICDIMNKDNKAKTY